MQLPIHVSLFLQLLFYSKIPCNLKNCCGIIRLYTSNTLNMASSSVLGCLQSSSIRNWFTGLWKLRSLMTCWPKARHPWEQMVKLQPSPETLRTRRINEIGSGSSPKSPCCISWRLPWTSPLWFRYKLRSSPPAKTKRLVCWGLSSQCRGVQNWGSKGRVKMQRLPGHQ